MKILVEGYNKSIHKRDNQLLIKEKDDEMEKINIKKIDDITIIGKGSITFDALRLISDNNIPLMSMDYFGKVNYILEYPIYENVF
jgi:CRISPR-associated protein Cas1